MGEGALPLRRRLPLKEKKIKLSPDGYRLMAL